MVIATFPKLFKAEKEKNKAFSSVPGCASFPVGFI